MASDVPSDANDVPGVDFDGDDLVDDDSTVHHIDAIELRSLGLVAGLFYFTAFLVLALAIAAVWLFAAGLGLISQLEDFMRSIGFRGFRLVGPEVILGFVLILGALVVFLTVMTLVAAAFYNLLGSGRRGVKIRTSVVHPHEGVEEPDAPAVIEPVAEAAGAEAGEAEAGGGAEPQAAAG